MSAVSHTCRKPRNRAPNLIRARAAAWIVVAEPWLYRLVTWLCGMQITRLFSKRADTQSATGKEPIERISTSLNLLVWISTRRDPVGVFDNNLVLHRPSSEEGPDRRRSEPLCRISFRIPFRYLTLSWGMVHFGCRFTPLKEQLAVASAAR